LLNAGVTFTFAADALGYHHDLTNLDRLFQRTREEGRADVLIAQRHPELWPVLPLTKLDVFLFPSRVILRKILARLRRVSLRHLFALIDIPRLSPVYAVRLLAIMSPTVGDILATNLRRMLDPLERRRLRQRWRLLFHDLLGYWYQRGVIEEAGTWKALRDLLRAGSTRGRTDSHEIELDLREGLEVAEQRLDEERPAGARIRYGSQFVGRIPAIPGAEHLCGRHLRPVLATTLAWPLLESLAWKAVTGEVKNAELLPANFSRSPARTTYARKNAYA